MNIQWYPGHMAKARRKLENQLRWVDIVIEVCDARLPISSRNPLLNNMLGSKPKLLLMNKADLADSVKTDQWLKKLGQESAVLAISALTGAGVKKISGLLENILADRMARLKARGVKDRPIRAMVVGIPNVGKSSLINQMVGGSRAKTGKKPGVTRENQWIRINPRIELLDTPGMLWPKFEDLEVGRKLAATGAIKDESFDQEELATWLCKWLLENYPQEFKKHYDLADSELDLEGIGRRRGCLISGGRIDTLKTAQVFLKDFRSGKIAKITMD
ncbi:MAG: ribosome biogenesis GTPase YlqF [Desulfitobacteriia bacterium]|jgi:ribosome biogenesis GTPase A